MKQSLVPSVIFRKFPILILLGTLVAGCAPAITRQDQPVTDPSLVSKKVSFAVLEDYDKGDDLNDVALDFALMNELEIDTMRCSFGWDDYEPVRGQYDFAWLEEFASLAQELLFGPDLQRPYQEARLPYR